MEELTKEQKEKMKALREKRRQRQESFHPLDLNEDTVLTIYRRLADTTNYHSGDDIKFVLLYTSLEDEQALFNKTYDVLAKAKSGDAVAFPKSNCEKEIGKLKYLLGQLYIFHHPEFTSSHHFIKSDELLKKYDGSNWTTNNGSIIALTSFGVLTNTFSPIRRDKSEALNNTFTIFNKVPPTLSPNDPNFEKWYEGSFKKTHDKDGLELSN